MLLTLTPLVFKSLTYKNGSASPVPGFGIIFFAILVIGLLGGGLWKLISKFRHASGNQKDQFGLVLLGLAGTFSLIILTNFVFVVLFNNSSLIVLAPAYTLIFTGSLGYAIVKHRLFDIRLLAARSLAYALSWLSMAAIFTTSAYAASYFLTDSQGNVNSSRLRLTYTILAVLLALIFTPLKRFFDRNTNRIFFRDAYDPQNFLDKFNNILVTTYQLDPLLHKISAIIEKTLNPTYCTFVLLDKTKMTYRSTGTPKRDPIDRDGLTAITENVPHAHQKIIVTDLLDHNNAILRETLTKNDIALMAVLSSTKGETVLRLWQY